MEGMGRCWTGRGRRCSREKGGSGRWDERVSFKSRKLQV